MIHLWRRRAVAIYIVIGVLCLTACLALHISGEGNTINIEREYDPSINLGENEHDESGESNGTSKSGNASDDTNSEETPNV